MSSSVHSQTDQKMFDWMDGILTAWVAVYFVLSGRANPMFAFPQGHALVGLNALLILTGLRVPQVKQALQSMGGASFCLVTGGWAASISIGDPVLEMCIPILFFYWSFFFCRVFISRCYGLSILAAQNDSRLRNVLQGPHYVAILLAIAESTFQFLATSIRLTALAGFWLLPYGLMIWRVWRMPAEHLPPSDIDSQSWKRALHGGRTILVSVLAVCFLGTVVGWMMQRNTLVWAIVCTILLFQALIVVRILRPALSNSMSATVARDV